MKSHGNAPIAIVRTLPPCYLDEKTREGRIYRRCLAGMKVEDSDQTFGFALPSTPKQEILHVYILCAGLVRWRFNFVAYDPTKLKCLDGVERGNFAVVCGPVSEPPREVKMRGFRGFRYIYNPLW